MYEHLSTIGIEETDLIERYSLRSEVECDTLKVYYKREKGDLFARSEKYKFPRQRKKVKTDYGKNSYSDISEIAPALRHVIEELDEITKTKQGNVDIKQKVLNDLKHLESVVHSKIAEIEADLEKL